MAIDIEKSLADLLAQSSSAPVLFIGSGFSRRYINLPTWIGLLENFSTKYPFARYLSKANGDIPSASLMLAEDFSNEWWEKNRDTDVYKSSEWKHSNETPLKYEISKYLKSYSIDIEKLKQHPELKELFSNKVVIDGIITTNWDLLLESIFPNLSVRIGQSEILFQRPSSIGEILKIHGCCTKYNSLVLTNKDYKYFNDKNPYLAARLLAIFLEKPVIFIGYSLSDENISEILEKISIVIDTEDKVKALSKNLIFVSRASGKDDSITKVMKDVNDRKLEITSIQTDDFSKIYKALQYSERKIPVEFLRIFEEQIYKIVNEKDQADLRLKAVNFESIINHNDDIEFIAGVGVVTQGEFGKRGLSGINADDLLRDIIFNDSYFPDEDIANILNDLIKNTPTYLPIRKYIKANPKLNVVNGSPLNIRMKEHNSSTYAKKADSARNRNLAKNGFKAILNDSNLDISNRFNALTLWLNDNKTYDSCTTVREYLKKNYSKLKTECLPKDLWKNTSFKRLVCMLDEIENNDLISEG